MVVDRLARKHEPVGDLGVPQALDDEAENLELPPGEAARVRARQRPRASAQLADALLAQDSRRAARGDPGAELLQPGEARTEVIVPVALEERERRLVRTAELGPHPGGGRRLALELAAGTSRRRQPPPPARRGRPGVARA